MLIGKVCFIGYLFSASLLYGFKHVSCQWHPWKMGIISGKTRQNAEAEKCECLQDFWEMRLQKALGYCFAGTALQICRQVLDRFRKAEWCVGWCAVVFISLGGSGRLPFPTPNDSSGVLSTNAWMPFCSISEGLRVLYVPRCYWWSVLSAWEPPVNKPD